MGFLIAPKIKTLSDYRLNRYIVCNEDLFREQTRTRVVVTWASEDTSPVHPRRDPESRLEGRISFSLSVHGTPSSRPLIRIGHVTVRHRPHRGRIVLYPPGRVCNFVFVVSVDSLDPIAISQDPSLSLTHKSPNMDHTTLTKKGVKDKTENLTRNKWRLFTFRLRPSRQRQGSPCSPVRPVPVSLK